MYILGISCFYHDAAAALLRDGLLVAAAEEERFTRKKHDNNFPASAINFCLRQANISMDQIDQVVFYEKPLLKFERILLTIIDSFPRSSRAFREAVNIWLGEKLWIKNIIREKLQISPEKIFFVEHHLSHTAASFFCSPFKEAAIISVDGVGEWTTTALGMARSSEGKLQNNQIDLFEELKFPHSLGLLYSAFTAYLGFEINEGEYKVMGMAPYGTPRYLDKVMKLLDLKEDGSFTLDLSYFSYHYHTQRTFSRKFEDLFGRPARNPKERFVTDKTSRYDDPVQPTGDEISKNQFWADLASSIQAATEEVMLKMARHLYRRTGLKKLCIAGGVGLNSVANYRILKEGLFDDIYIQPAAGDSGGAVGAALYFYHVILQKPRQFVMEHAFWGEEYSDERIRQFLESRSIRYELIEDKNKVRDRVIDSLINGKIVGWYQGRFEWGPRALGHRSILADPRRAEMKDIVNIKIKFREPFRPFAPSVLEENVSDFFELPAPYPYPARFMLLVTPVKTEAQNKIPAVTHVDGTGRLQIVSKETNADYYQLIKQFGEATGVPVLLNTSFNLKGEPIVSSPADAYNTFSKSGIDLLVLKNYLISK
ncbi:MAG: carbamoyltransferase [Planctomycetota bacterium]